MVDFASNTMLDPKGYLTEEQVNTIINAATNLRDRLLLQMIYRCGRRVSEVLMVKEEDILWDDRRIIFNILKRKKPVKELKPVDDETFELLREYVKVKDSIKGLKKRPENGVLFPVSRQYVFKLIRKLGKKVGIERVGRKGLHPHHLRHSFAVHQVRTHIKTPEDLRRLQMYMGHTNMATTAHYLQYSTEELRDIVDIWGKKKPDKNGKRKLSG
jgi:integrase/recombinase XerD